MFEALCVKNLAKIVCMYLSLFEDRVQNLPSFPFCFPWLPLTSNSNAQPIRKILWRTKKNRITCASPFGLLDHQKNETEFTIIFYWVVLGMKLNICIRKWTIENLQLLHKNRHTSIFTFFSFTLTSVHISTKYSSASLRMFRRVLSVSVRLTIGSVFWNEVFHWDHQ